MAYQSGQAMQVTIQGPGPWGFRLAGGRDFNTPIHISKITPGGKAARSNLLPNDTVTSINGTDTSVLTHLEAQNKIKGTVGDLSLNIQRGDSKIWKPKITDDYSSGGQPAVNVSLAADKQKFTHAGSAHNVAAKPFPGGGGGGPPAGGLGTATVVHKQFNSPVGIYSSENIAETFKGQTEGMITGALGGESGAPGGPVGGGPGAGYQTGSPVYQAVQSEQSGDYGYRNPAVQSRSFKMLQQMTQDEADYGAPASQAPPPAAPAQQQQQPRVAGTRSVKAPTTRPGAGGPKPETTLPICEGCNRAIVGQMVHVNPPDEERPRWDGPFVKVRNRSLHPECFKCQTCGCSLRNQGYFWVEGGMYCERDAKAKATPPPGANVVMSSNTSGGVPNGTSRPMPTQQAHAPRAPQAQRVQPAQQRGPPRSQPVPVNAPQDGVKVMFLPNNGPGVKQTPSQVAQQSRAPQHTPSPPRLSGLPHQAPRPGPTAYQPATSHPSSHGPSGPAAGPGSRGPSKMVDSGTRTPVCDGCNSIIRGPFVSAIGRNWHPEHFVCAHCHENLKDKTFVEEKGKIYCEDDFVKLYAEKCHKCHKNIGGPGVSALGGKFHPECFVCEHCKEPIVGGKFRLSDGKPYCEKDYRALHSTMCSGCEFIIDPGDPWLEALDKAWHANCFVCSICQSPLEGQSFYAKMGRPFCQAHAN